MEGDRPRFGGDREGYRSGAPRPGYGDKGGAPGEFRPEFRGVSSCAALSLRFCSNFVPHVLVAAPGAKYRPLFARVRRSGSLLSLV